MITFSIIIPTYNSSNTIKSCIESILNQTYENYEILIIDGLSTDATLEHVNSYSDPRIRVYSEHDRGIYDAMNKGIKHAKGEWTYFLGSDDKIFDKNVLYDISKIIYNENIDVVYGNVLMIETNKIYDGEFNKDRFLNGELICHQAIFYKKTIHKVLGLYDIKYKVLADHNLNLKWFFNKKLKHKYTERTIAYYSINGFSSANKDTLFYNALPEKLLRLGFRKYNINTLKELSNRAASNNKKSIKYPILKTIYYSLRLIDIINRRIV